MAKLRIGYLLPTRDWTVLGNRDLPDLVEQARAAEEMGFDSVWAGDSPVTRPRADALMVLAAAAAVTDRIVLGTAVLLPALRHPLLLAHQLATLDGLAGGRLIAGMGAGFAHPYTEAQFRASGVDFKRRISRMEESIGIMRRLWSEESVSHEGAHFAFHDVTLAPKPVQDGGPPIWLAGSGEPALRRVARLADGWMPYPPTHEGYAEDLMALANRVPEQAVTLEMSATGDLEKAAVKGARNPMTAETVEAGRLSALDTVDADGFSPPEISVTDESAASVGQGPGGAFTPALYATICLDEDPERARHRLRASVERYYNAPLEFVESIQAMFAGTPADVVTWLNGYAAAGARHVVIRLAVDDHRPAMEQFADQVLAKVRENT
ncbi:LLM class flavin-dependent oxidoreductase [Nonomuraea basaltis]|uniref:LLM class flavin-dependent oxidoreductase n=1 Tax=Nonomuraea basaltis TaxID=2495887 RepID=UPI00110C4E2D|nr:LLM class flavin-dependent oxidoreductase [Nonomuraea basaltis]TMR89894.1 LLM class flavin-dependent oxidoreductase [Nonomuraea basaltis]